MTGPLQANLQFRIADTFTDALARLPALDQKAVKASVFDLQTNPVSNSLQFHRIGKSKDPNFWSVRVNRDIRIIVHKTADSMLLAYVDHHDKAYQWAERRRVETHPSTGAAQMVVVRERVEELAPSKLDDGSPKSAVATQGIFTRRIEYFRGLTGDQLLSVGVPPDWVNDVLAADEDKFLSIAQYLPAEASEALLEFVASGILPVPKHKVTDEGFAHPDALRRFRTIDNVEDLRQALEYPWDKWAVYLHPSQRETIARDINGPARVSGSAGTGKTVVALHRAVRLACESEDARVLLTTFSQPLAESLSRKLKVLVAEQEPVLGRITVTPFHGVAEQLYELLHGRRPHIASEVLIRGILERTAKAHAVSESMRFLLSEWLNVIDAWQLASEEAYAKVPRLGRKNRMGAKQRAKLWPVFQALRESLSQKGAMTWAQVLAELSTHYADLGVGPFTHVVVDEAQDLGVPELGFLAAIAPKGANNLFFAADLGQRIFQQPFSWLTLGVDVRGRSQTLKVNYRTSHQIREVADRLLPKSLRDVDGQEESRAGTISVFNGPAPDTRLFENGDIEVVAVGEWIAHSIRGGIEPREIGVFVRSHAQMDRARAALKAAGQEGRVLTEPGQDAGATISVGTMHLAKGLEFKAVAVMACDDEVLPLQERIDTVADEVELDDVYETERQLLYVACTRARDRLLVSGVAPGSEFLADLRNGQ